LLTHKKFRRTVCVISEKWLLPHGSWITREPVLGQFGFRLPKNAHNWSNLCRRP
jgi:hypothetical protein